MAALCSEHFRQVPLHLHFPLSFTAAYNSSKVAAAIQARREKRQKPPNGEPPQRRFTEVILSTSYIHERLAPATSNSRVRRFSLVEEEGGSELSKL